MLRYVIFLAIVMCSCQTSTPAPQNPISFSGNGNTIIDVNKWTGPAIARISNQSSIGQFSVASHELDGTVRGLVDASGQYSGSILFDFINDEKTIQLEVSSQEQWSIDILPLEDARIGSIDNPVSGSGDDVILFEGRPVSVQVDIKGPQSKFRVWAYGTSSELLAIGTSPYSNTILIPIGFPTNQGKVWIYIQSLNDWTLITKTN
jgi:hypothetical protein